MPDVFANNATLSTTSSSGTDAPAALTSQTWTVNALSALWPALSGSQTMSIQDPLAQSEIMRITASTGSGAVSITVTRGVDGTTPVAHGTGATFINVAVASALNGFGNAFLTSPAFSGTPTAPTAAPGTNTTQLATTAFVEAATNAVPVNTQSFASTYILALTDAGTSIQAVMTGAGIGTITIPLNASVAFPVGSILSITQTSSNAVKITATGGVTVQTSVGAFSNGVTGCRAQYSTIGLLKVATDTWQLSGDVA